MRPEILFSLFKPVERLAGIGPRLAKLISRVAGPHVVDLLWHLPRDIVDRRPVGSIAEAQAGRVVTLTLIVDKHQPGSGRRPYRIRCRDETGFLTLVYFHAKEDYLRRILPEGQERLVSGRIEHFGEEVQVTHPDYVVAPQDRHEIPVIEPVYALTQGLTPKVVARAVRGALAECRDLPEWLDPAFKQQRHFSNWKEAVLEAHAPKSAADLSPETPVRQRLAYDELLANQLALGLVRLRARKLAGRRIEGSRMLRDKVLAALPFTLTGAQARSLQEIEADMAAPERMLRLLQGDVGSGKTVVALLAMLNAVECGGQAVLMAPTEILARQHIETIAPLLEAVGLDAVILTGRDKGAARNAKLERLSSGSAAIAVGTHALFQSGVEFSDLMLAVIDEQHRFGVHQRLTLSAKGRGVDTLVMTATPIPRTLALTAYGDMDVSRLDEKPPGRKPVDTRTVPLARLEEVVQAVARATAGGAKIYWVCPLVEESESSDLANAEARAAELRVRFGDAVELVHGRLSGPAKDKAMARFAEGPAQILVATTVIEVGVNVPAATVMVIEHAERFGLAQLHQLRGRIGRGEAKSTCLLLYGEGLSETARARLKVLRETEDGFVIAEEDLRLRGGGEVLGTRQSGLPTFRIADIGAHGDLMQVARDDTKLILERDPNLETERGKALRVLLYLFERDAAALTLRSG